MYNMVTGESMKINMEPGQIAFEAYRVVVDGVTHDGRPIPNWNELGESVRAGWRAAADAVLMTSS